MLYSNGSKKQQNCLHMLVTNNKGYITVYPETKD